MSCVCDGSGVVFDSYIFSFYCPCSSDGRVKVNGVVTGFSLGLDLETVWEKDDGLVVQLQR